MKKKKTETVLCVVAASSHKRHSASLKYVYFLFIPHLFMAQCESVCVHVLCPGEFVLSLCTIRILFFVVLFPSRVDFLELYCWFDQYAMNSDAFLAV